MPPTLSREKEGIRVAIAAIAGLGVTLLLNYCAFRLHFNLSTASSINLLVVVLTALRFGFWQATASSFLAIACLDYFFDPPIFSLRIVNSEN